MHSFIAFISFAFLATLALAAPTPRTHKTKFGTHSFVVPRFRREEFVRNGKTAMAKAYRKFNWPMPGQGDGLQDAASILGQLFGEASGSNEGSDSNPFTVSIITIAPTATAAPTATSTSTLEFFSSSTSSTSSSTSAAATSSGSNYQDNTNAAAESSSAAAAAANGGPGETGTTVATPAEGDSEYISPVTIGGQTLNLVSNFGSIDIPL